jgi:hypothetical protein
MIRIASLALLLLGGCATPPVPSAQDAFFAALSSHCGQTLKGQLASSDAQDREMLGKPMSAHFTSCTAKEVRINFAVGEDKSRNWVISRIPAGLRLKHIHLHTDGTEDAVSRYGGDTVAEGTATRQQFPADQFSKDLFTRTNRPESRTNIWAVEVEDGIFFGYELRRPEGRFFRVELQR